MARNERDREDIMREATALVERAELRIAGYDENIVIGFRRDGCGSIFLGPDVVYQFNSHGELRRGYHHGNLIKAERGRLVSLARQRQADEVQLVRHPLLEDETVSLLDELKTHIECIVRAFQYHKAIIVCQVPSNGDVHGRIHRWLAKLGTDIAVARVPNVR